MRPDKRKTLYLILFCLLQLGIVVSLIVLQDRHWPIRGLHERKKWRVMMKDLEKGVGDGPKVCFGTVELRGPDRSGGIGATVHSLAFLLASKGFRVTLVYAGQLGSSQAQFWEKPFSEFGIRFVFLPDHLKTHSIPSTMASFKMYRWLREHEDECDIVHFHDYVGIGYFSMLAQKMGLAFENMIFQLDGHAAHAFAREGAQRAVANLDEMNMEYMERRSVELTDLIVAPSQFLVDWMKKEWQVNAKEIRVIQNVLPGKPEEESRVLNSINEIVYFGKFDKLKGIDIFLNAIDNLSQRNGIQIDMVTFIGIPMEFTSYHISQRAKKWGIPYQIYTYKDTSFAMEYLKSHDAVAVFPSRAENSPTVILESVSNGICFVASKVGGIPELIGDEWKEVHLFEPNGKDLASKLYNLLKNGCQTPLLAKSLEQTRRLQIDWHSEVFNLTSLKTKPVYTGENNSHICVVIPFYNRYSTIPDALASLQAQTYKNFEVIIVNDGSEENAVKNLESTVKEFDPYMKITVIHQENKYLSAARNTGAKSCNGDWIMFLDDDDISKPEQLQTYLKAAINIGADALTNIIDVFKGDKPGSTFDERWLGSGPSIELSFFKNNLGATANIFIKKEVFDKSGGFNEEARGFEDWEYGVRLMLSGFKLEMVPESLYWYRDSPGSMMKTLNEYAANKIVIEQYLSKIPKQFHPILKLARVLSDQELKSNSGLDSWNNWYHINPF